MIAGSDSGRIVILEYNPLKNVFEQVSLPTVVVNPRRTCAARVTVVCLCVIHSFSLSDTTLQASVVDRVLEFRYQRNVDNTLECFDLWIL